MAKRKLKRQLGLVQLVMLGTAGTIAAEIFVLTGHAAAIAGPATVLAVLIRVAVALVSIGTAVSLVKVFRDGKGDQTRSITTYPEVTPSAVAETEDFSAPTAFDKTLLSTLTPAEYMSQVLLTDRRIETDPQNARQDAAIEMGGGMAAFIDQTIFGNFDALTGGTVQFMQNYDGGLTGFVARAQELAEKYGERFAPTARLVEMAEQGETFPA